MMRFPRAAREKAGLAVLYAGLFVLAHLGTVGLLRAAGLRGADGGAAPAPVLPAPDPYPLHRAEVIAVHDGDTARFRIDLNFDCEATAWIRFAGYNAPELHGPHPADGARATESLTRLLASGPVWVRSVEGKRTFARWVGEVYVESDGRLHPVADTMKGRGFDVPQGQ